MDGWCDLATSVEKWGRETKERALVKKLQHLVGLFQYSSAVWLSAHQLKITKKWFYRPPWCTLPHSDPNRLRELNTLLADHHLPMFGSDDLNTFFEEYRPDFVFVHSEDGILGSDWADDPILKDFVFMPEVRGLLAALAWLEIKVEKSGSTQFTRI